MGIYLIDLTKYDLSNVQCAIVLENPCKKILSFSEAQTFV